MTAGRDESRSTDRWAWSKDDPGHSIYLMSMKPSFSVIVPFFNEGENVVAVCQELELVLRSMSPGGEVILIDDGSTDGTAEVMDRLAENWPHCHVHHQAHNQGQAAALLTGFSEAKAPLIVTMDGDGQNDPRDIPRLLVRLQEADMVVGIRTGRQDSWPRRIISRLANSVRARWLGDGVSDAGCAIKAFRREVIGAFIPIRTLYSFMPALAVAAGFQVVEEPVNHRPRQHGHSRYTVRSFLFWPIVDCIGLGWFRSRRCRPSLPRVERPVDAISGHVVGIRKESAEEERLEMATEDRAAKVTPRQPPF